MWSANDWIAGRPAWLDVAVYNDRAIRFHQRHGFRPMDAAPQLAAGVIPVAIMERAGLANP
jgi:ribosomal protein S18 acetylase RimI-like enzyme